MLLKCDVSGVCHLSLRRYIVCFKKREKLFAMDIANNENHDDNAKLAITISAWQIIAKTSLKQQ